MIDFRNVQRDLERIAPDYGITLEEWNPLMLIICMLCFGHSQNQNSVNLSMRIKVQAVVFVKKEYPQIRKDFGKESILESKFLPVDSGVVHRLMLSRSYIETQGEKKKMNIAYRFRIYPNREHEVLLMVHLAAVVFYIIRC